VTESCYHQKQAAAVDIYIAGRLRLARKALKLSQEALAEELGVTFQQVQKYETGTTRISASRLYRVALIFGQPVSYFFPPLPDNQSGAVSSTRSNLDRLVELMGTPDAAALQMAYLRIKDAQIRRRLLALVRSIADEQE
jgi:transcriptional regulator with XRE-family HTH domain